MHRLQLVTLVILLSYSAATAAPGSAPPASICEINVIGNGEAGGVKSASIKCSGNALSMAVSPSKLGKFKQQFKGVIWDADSCGNLDCVVTFCGSTNVVVKDSAITSVHDAESTGMLCIVGNSKVTISSSLLQGNIATNGTIHARDDADVLVLNSTVADAVGVRGGGAQFDGRSKLTTINSTWSGNTADFGAAINVRENATAHILGGNTFDSNYAVASYNYGPAGGVLYCRANGKVYVRNYNLFVNNIADGYDSAGGAFFTQDDCVLDIRNGSVFRSNAALQDNAVGGAILGCDRSLVTISGNITFFNNTAIGDNCGGGAVMFRDDTTGTITNGITFTENAAIGDVGQGGAVYASNNARLLIENDVTFYNNTAAGVNSQGGAINTRQDAETIIRRGVKFIGNHASYGGGIAAVGNMLFNISDAVFRQHAVLGHGGGMYLEGSFAANIVNCMVTNNRAAQGGGIMATASTSSSDSNFTLTASGNTKVMNNSASTGGGLSLVSGHTVISRGVVISGNRAAQGGGISISEGPTGSANCTLSPQAKVSNNTAFVAGGGIYLDAVSVRINEATARAIATNNTAAFGPDLSLISECLPGEVRAGAWCQECGANLYSFNPSNTSCDICPDYATCTGGTVIIPRKGYWHSSDWSTQIHRCPNPVACNQPGLDEIYARKSGVYTVVQPGELAAAATAAAGTLGAATPAAIGGAGSTRSLLGVDRDLSDLVRPRLRDLLQNQAVVLASSADQESVLPALPGANMNWQCAPGYKGHLCGSCAADHGLQAPFRCAQCMSPKAAIALYVVSFLVLMVIIWIMSHVAWLDNQDTNPDLRISDILKIVVVYIQCLVILTGLPVEWPGSIAGVFAGFTWLFSAGNSQLLSFDCLVAHLQLTLPVSVVRQLMYLLAPVAMFIAVVLLQCAIRCVHHIWRRMRRRRIAVGVLSEVWDRIPVIAVVTLMFFYPSLVRVALSMFACYPIDTNAGFYPTYAVANASTGYWQHDMQQACWVGWHRDWALGLGLPFTLMFCMGVPVGIVLLLWRNSARHDDVSFRKHCGLLYRLYRKGCFAWEAVVAGQMVLLVFVSVFGPNIGAWHEALLLNFFFGVFMVLLMIFRPYKFQRLHTIALLAMGCLSFTAYAALSFLPNMSNDVERVYKEVAGALVLVLNLGFLLWIAYCILLLIKQFVQRIRNLRNLSKLRGKGPQESVNGYPTDAPLGNARAASMAGANAGATAAKAVAAAAARAGKTAADGTARGPLWSKPAA